MLLVRRVSGAKKTAEQPGLPELVVGAALVGATVPVLPVLPVFPVLPVDPEGAAVLLGLGEGLEVAVPAGA